MGTSWTKYRLINFKSWLSESVIYHGSKNPIEQWDSSRHLSGYYPGFYAWPELAKAKQHGEYVYTFNVDDSLFYQMNDPEELKTQAKANGFPTTSGSGFQDVSYLKSLGYKGIKRGMEYIIFNPEEWSDEPVGIK